MRYVLLALMLIAGTVSQAQQDSPIADTKGDAVDLLGEGPPLHDIDVVHLSYDKSNLYVSTTFYSVISAPSLNDPATRVTLFVEIDTDQNPETGREPTQSQPWASPPLTALPLGIDVMIDFSREASRPGSVEVVTAKAGQRETWPGSSARDGLTWVPVVFTSHSASCTVPLSVLSDDGIVDFTAIAGGLRQPTDALEVYGHSVVAAAVTGKTWAGIKSLYR
jgi:hypothetical protein